MEVGANTTIDRAFLYETRIGRGVKIDNLVQIAHNVNVGAGSIMAAQVGIAGSSRIGAGCLFGGKAAMKDNISLGEGSIVAAATNVSKDWPAGSKLMGSPAGDMKEHWRMLAAQGRLPELLKRVKALEARVGQE